MLGFLRKIRRKNIEPTKMKKVILYALGEIFLVVIGILIAVQLNNWNNQRRLESAERITLSRLHEDLRSDMSRFDFLDSAMNHHINLCDSVIGLIEKQSSLNDRLELIRIDPVEVFLLETNTTTYEEMLNTGRLYSLSSPRLRSWITLYYRQAKKWGSYSDGNTDRIRSAMNQEGLNDYWVIQSKLERKKPISTKLYPWLNETSSEELRSIENLMYLTSSVQQLNLGNYDIIKRICETLLEELDAHRKR